MIQLTLETIEVVKQIDENPCYIVNEQFIVPKTPDNKDYLLVQEWISNGGVVEEHITPVRFNADEAIAREAQVFTTDRIVALAPFTYTINEMIRYENWDQLKDTINALISGGMATNDDYETFNSILKEQNIDLDLI
jgi:hypothetical protein